MKTPGRNTSLLPEHARHHRRKIKIIQPAKKTGVRHPAGEIPLHHCIKSCYLCGL